MKIYKDPQISDALLQDKTICILGYGNQGRPQALNLKDSGIHVIVGARPGSTKREEAQRDGFVSYDIAEAVDRADVIMMLVPDEAMSSVYKQWVRPHLKPGKYLGFSHGLAIHAELIQPDPIINVFLLAPKAQGRGVRNKYLEGSGVPALVAVHQDPSGNTLQMALAYGKALGCGRTGILQTTFANETETDLFSEQTILCGGLTQMIKTGFEVLVEAGYDPEVAYFECLYEVKLIADLLQEGGITQMREKISSTALFGDVTQGRRVIDNHVKETMKSVLRDIQSGHFTTSYLQDVAEGRKLINERITQDFHHPIEETGRKLREAGVL